MFNSGKEFNDKNLFLYFNGLATKYQGELISKHIDSVEDCDRNTYLHDEFVYKAYYAYSILQRMRLLKKEAFKAQFDVIKPTLNLNGETEILYSSFLTREYIYFIMPFLNTMFILQDRILPIIGHYLGIRGKLPNKLPEYYYGLMNKRNLILRKFPKKIQDLVIDYFKTHGQHFREYRNLDQHQFNLTFHSFYRLKPKEEFVIYLPDKYVKDYNKLSYVKKIVALDYFESEFKAFHEFVENIIKSLGILPKKYQNHNSFLPLEPLEHYKNGELLSLWIIGAEVIQTRISSNNKPNSKAKKISLKKTPNKVTKINWEFS